MNFQSSITNIVESHGTADDLVCVGNASGTSGTSHPRLWAAFEHRVTHRYEADTGTVVTAGFDWSAPDVIKWIIENLPIILTFLKVLLMLFAL